MEGTGDRRPDAFPAEARMWLNERRRGPGWSASSPPAGSAASSASSFLNVRPRRPRARRLPRGRCLSWGLLGVRVRDARRLGLGCTAAQLLLVPAARLQPPSSWLPPPGGWARISCGGAAPQEPPPRTVLLAHAGGGARGGGTLKRARPPDSPRLRATVVAPSLREGASRLRPWPLAEDLGAPNSSTGVGSREDPFSVTAWKISACSPSTFRSLSNAARVAKGWDFRCFVAPQSSLVEAPWPGLG
ncbi:uncharacterized protein LOC118888029 [Balaenoptera musculus]|uniref:Uncharacterized protein LOC118888029 n=1 Tax=Balaenoptera musculus TaxID=9771 RepID=A0A8B8WEL5_BALMU|nr:uncharacterized protein LOC118888029 [Balaenoptera musculus]